MYGCTTKTISFIYIRSLLQEQSNDVSSVQCCCSKECRLIIPINTINGTPSCNMLSLRLTTPLLVARWNRSTRSLSIYMEETVKSKQFDVCQTLWHSAQSSTFVQTLVEVKKILFRMEINLSAINNLQYFWKIGICNN